MDSNRISNEVFFWSKEGATDLKDFALDNFELVRAEHKEDYLQLYRNYREFYMSERNFMLTSSALFISFVFHRLCATISKLNDLENEIEEGKLVPSAEEVKPEAKEGLKEKAAWMISSLLYSMAKTAIAEIILLGAWA